MNADDYTGYRSGLSTYSNVKPLEKQVRFLM